MSIILTSDLQALVDEKVKSGLYDSPSEVVHAGLQLLKQRDQFREFKREELRREIMKGKNAIKEGRFTTLKTAEDYENLFEEITSQGREQLNADKNGK